MNKFKQGDTVMVSSDAPQLYTEGRIDWESVESTVDRIDGDAVEIDYINEIDDELCSIVIPAKYLIKVDTESKKPFVAEDKIMGDWQKAWYEKYSPLHRPFVPTDRPVPKDYLNKCLELQRELTRLQCECKRFADYVMNLTHGRDAMAIQFDDEYLRMAGDMLFKFFGCLPKNDFKEIIKELKK